MSNKERIAVKALQAIVALDLAKTPEGRDDFYSGPDRFFRAYNIAYEALRRFGLVPNLDRKESP